MTSITPYNSSNIILFTPDQISGLSLWLDAADSSSVVTSGSNVTAWNDKSGNGRNMVQNASFQRPTYSPNSLNGNNSILFFRNASNSFSILENTSFNFTTSSWTYFTVLRRNAANTTFQRFLSMASVINGQDNNNSFSMNLNSSSPNNFFNMERNSGSLAGTFNTSNVCLLENIVNGSLTNIDTFNANTNYLFTNGSPLTSGAGLSVGATLTIAHTRYGCATFRSATNDAGFESLQGNIGEVLLFNRTLRQSELQQVESYLAWKWNLQSNLPSTHPYSRTPYVAYNQYVNLNQQLANTTTMFPNQVSNLALWLDAADSATITHVGGAISQWRDKSGNGYNATGFSSPLYVNNVINNLSVVRFNGTSSYFSIPGNQLDLTTEDFAIFAVIQYTPRVAQIPIIGKAVGASATLQWRLSFDPNNIFQIIVFKNSVAISSSSSYTTAGWTLFSGVVYRATSIQGFINATGLNVGGTVVGTLSDTAVNVEIGRGWSGTQFFNSDMGEILLYKGTVTVKQRQQIEAYLMYKWNLQSFLPPNHPAYIQPLPVSVPRNIQNYNISPTQYAGCVLWLDALDSSIVGLSGTNITSLRDKSSNTYLFSNATGFTYNVNKFNGSYPSFFSSSATTGRNLGSNTSINFTQPLTVFVVCSKLTDANGAYLFDGVVNANRIAYYSVRGRVFAGSEIAASTDIISNPCVISAIYNTANSVALLNGTPYTSGDVGTRILASGLTLGSRFTNTESWDGHICEVIFYNSVLIEQQRQQIEGYLAWKWNTQRSLPTNHRFYNYPPG